MINNKDSYLLRTTGVAPEDTVLWVSPAARKLFYFNPVGKKISDIFPRYSIEENNTARQGMFVSIDSNNFILSFIDVGLSDGIILNLFPLDLFADFSGSEENMTDEVKKRAQALKMAVKDLELNRKKLKHANEVTGTGSFEYLHDLKCLVLSQEACRVLGINPERSVVSVEEICSSTSGHNFKKLCEAMTVAAESAKLETEITIKDDNGGLRHLLVFMKKLSTGTASIDGILHDITYKRDTEQKLRRQNTYYRTLYDNANIGIFILNSEGLILDYNIHLSEMIGYDPDELRGRKATEEIIAPKDKEKVRGIYERIVSGEYRIQSEDFSIIKKDGSWLDVLGSFEYIMSPDEEPVIFGFLSDISTLKDMQHKNIEQERMLLQQSKMATMGEMVGIIAHQWVQPLNSIAMISQMMQELVDVDEEAEQLIRKTVSSIVDQVKFMTDTVNDFRDFLKPSSVATEFRPSDAVMSVLDLYRPQLKYHNVKCGLFFESEELKKVTVYGYENEFKNVILNLCTNAKDALEQNQIDDAEIEIAFSTDDDCKHVIISVEDNGGGFPADMMDKIFNAYISTKGEKGTGLGLYMSKLIIKDRMNGEISVKNTDQGAKISVTLENINKK